VVIGPYACHAAVGGEGGVQSGPRGTCRWWGPGGLAAARQRWAWSSGVGGREAGEERVLTDGVGRHSTGRAGQTVFETFQIDSIQFKLIQTNFKLFKLKLVQKGPS
jgi:hypothetical protein